MELSIIPWQVFLTLPPSENPASAAPLSTSAASRRNDAEIKCGAARTG